MPIVSGYIRDMRSIVLATGIYPPDIGGPATYVRALAREFTKMGYEVTVVTYGEMQNAECRMQREEGWRVVKVRRNGGPLLRWWRYSRALRKYAANTDSIEAFSSVSVGVPLALACLKRPKKVLRLGGDFFWERYTDRGGRQPLRTWYATRPIRRWCMGGLLRTFDFLIFSSRFQQDIFEEHFRLPEHCVIENAFVGGTPQVHIAHRPLRLLFFGRFVPFKNILELLKAVSCHRNVRLTLVGEGPQHCLIENLVERLGLQLRVMLVSPVDGEEIRSIFSTHDLLILPSLTEISPNTALEARSAGLPVLLTKETGLSEEFTSGMKLTDLSTADLITAALREAEDRYGAFAAEASSQIPKREWRTVAQEHVEVFEQLCGKDQ
ncbi:MAG: glycosyltransferase family 4 protein [Candidatus Peribacteraceae bacterium]|nr:glycosyltransferase family 4 protein [Candidatus Peribacteraceae bacterium]